MHIRSIVLSALVCLLPLPVPAQTRQRLSTSPATSSAEAFAPAVELPSTGSVFALEKQAGSGTIVPLHATEIKSNSHAGGNFARSLVYAGPHSGVELSGAHAAVTLPGTTVFYVRLASDNPDLQREQATLVRLQEKPDSRQVVEFSRNIFGGSLKRKVDEVAIEKLDVEGQPVLRITPVKPLEPGEYGVSFMPKDPSLFSEIVYDFSVAK